MLIQFSPFKSKELWESSRWLEWIINTLFIYLFVCLFNQHISYPFLGHLNCTNRQKHLPTLCQVFESYLHDLPLQNLTIYGCISFQHIFCLDLSYNPNLWGKLFYFGNGTHQLIAFIEILFNDIHIHNSIQSQHVFTSQTSFQIVGTPNIPNSQSENLSLEGLGNAPFLLSHISTWIGVFDLG